ncbi:MAG: hypothetical protein GXP22_04910 [Gammaproteobacteria bacterium]|nr:hypothetical protein [Gammaproteobacteria bacterium]
MFDLQEKLDSRLKALGASKDTDADVRCIGGNLHHTGISKKSIIKSLKSAGLMSDSGKIRHIKTP